jgi:hypothetical protein
MTETEDRVDSYSFEGPNVSEFSRRRIETIFKESGLRYEVQWSGGNSKAEWPHIVVKICNMFLKDVYYFRAEEFTRFIANEKAKVVGNGDRARLVLLSSSTFEKQFFSRYAADNDMDLVMVDDQDSADWSRVSDAQ